MTNKQIKAIEERLYDLRKRMEIYEKTALSKKRRSLLLNMIQMICTATIPAFLLFGSFEKNYFYYALLVMSITSYFASTLSFLNRGEANWEQYRLLNERLHKATYDFEESFSKLSDQSSEKDYEKLVERLITIQEMEKSIWFLTESRTKDLLK